MQSVAAMGLELRQSDLGALGNLFPACLSSPYCVPFFPLLLNLGFGPQLTFPPSHVPFLLALACAALPALKPLENLLAYPPFLVTLFESYIFLRNSPAYIVCISNSLSFWIVHTLDKLCSSYRKMHICM